MGDTIKGYVKMPFHGESAYDIAVRYGYSGTEEEWLNSLGFIPDGSLGQEKLNEKLNEFIAKSNEVRNVVFSVSEKYKKEEFNIYSQEDEYVIPYMLKGKMGTYSVKIPKLAESVTVFNEENETLYSSAAERYAFAKADISSVIGKNIKISGRTQAMPYYPLAFCTDAEGNILARYGTEAYCVYGYTFPEDYETTVTEKDALEAVVPEGAKYLYIQGGIFTSGSNIVLDAEPMLEIGGEEALEAGELYKKMQSPLWGKKLWVDGDSICYGNGYTGGFGKIIADKFNMTLINNAVGGATFGKYSLNTVSYTDMDWENNTYYLLLSHFDPIENKNREGFGVKMTKEEYENGYGVYPTVYKLTNGELIEQEYSETMPSYTFFVKFDVPTYDGNTLTKYYRMFSSNSWLWEAYKSGFKSAHESGNARFGTARHWLCESVKNVDADADYILIEGGINDYLMNRPVGELTQGMTDTLDITTAAGGLEYALRYLLEHCAGKKIALVLTHKTLDYPYKTCPNYSSTGATLTDYHNMLLSVAEKYSISCVDLYNVSAFNTEMESFLKYTRNEDGVHPTKEGYELFYVPHIVSCMEKI